MISVNKLNFYYSDSLLPYRNQAVEKLLLCGAKQGEITVYLWKNERTVVIGKNQSSSAECNIAALESDGGHLARRISGGGAVYHDSSNLNYSFIAHADNYSVDKQTGIILDAVKAFGIPAESTGRNDIAVGGRKFSGNAYYRNGENCLHHGTLLISTDNSAMEKYLNVNNKKLVSKGVSSVKSRVVNLGELCADISCESLEINIVNAAVKHYNITPDFCEISRINSNDLIDQTRQFASKEWRYEFDPPFDIELESRMSFGLLCIKINVMHGRVSDCRVYSDCLDYNLPEQISNFITLTGAPLNELPCLIAASELNYKNEIADMFKEL